MERVKFTKAKRAARPCQLVLRFLQGILHVDAHLFGFFINAKQLQPKQQAACITLKLLGLLGHLTLAGLPEDHRRRGALDEVNFIKGVPA